MTPSAPRQVRAGNRSLMTLDGTRTFLVGASRPVVIDPGPADETHLQEVLSALGGAVPEAIVLTHGHADHAGNALALAEHTGAPLCMARGALSMPFEASRVDRWLQEGDVLESDAGTLRVVETPGHVPEHLAFFWQQGSEKGTLFAGDLFLGAGDTTVVSLPEGSVAAYLRSLERVEELGPAIVYPAHGPPLRRPEEAVRRFREHRLRRIDEVREIHFRDGSLTAEEMVELIYGPELDPRLRGAARGSIEAIRVYLEAEEPER